LDPNLRNIRGTSLLWQTERESGAGWDEDENDEPAPTDGWQSYVAGAQPRERLSDIDAAEGAVAFEKGARVVIR